MKITKSTKNYSACPQIKELLNECDSVLIGAGAGLSVSEGFSYSGKRFEKYFSDFKNKYGFSDMYSGGFYPYKTIEDSFWEKAAARYSTFIEKHQNKKILFLELGVGFNTPGIIKYPFWQMTLQNPVSHYVSINKGESYCPTEIQNRSFCIDEDIGKVLERL